MSSSGLWEKERVGFFQRIKNLFKEKPSKDTLAQLEDMLIEADFGVQLACELTEVVKKKPLPSDWTSTSWDWVQHLLHQEFEKYLSPYVSSLESVISPINQASSFPQVILMMGVNGSGKTTTIAKLGYYCKSLPQPLSVAFVAADTFRAAAVEQLEKWGGRLDIPVYTASTSGHKEPAALVYEAWMDARQKNIQLLVIDTAGRLQNNQNLMAELSKIYKVLKKADVAAPYASLLVLDGTVGQNAISQVEGFQKASPISGFIMSKMDGTAKGGILTRLMSQYKIPMIALGVGEKLPDLISPTVKELTERWVG